MLGGYRKKRRNGLPFRSLLQGFPDSFKIPVSDTQAYRQFGNSVVVPLMSDVAKLIVAKLEQLDTDPQIEIAFSNIPQRKVI